MSEEDARPGQVAEVAKAVGEIVKTVPVYQDALQPAAKELGKGLEVVAKAVNAALIPVEGLIWGVEQIRDFVRERVISKLRNVPPEEIQAPKPHIGVPTIDALRYTGAETDLSELYANLLATSMDRATAYRAHPGFVDMIKNMSPDEARIIRFLAEFPYYPLINVKRIDLKDTSFRIVQRHQSMLGQAAKCEYPDLAPNYMDNLERLGLIKVEPDIRMQDKFYKEIEDQPVVRSAIKSLDVEGVSKPEIQRMRLGVTNLGKQFIRACVLDKNSQPRD